MHSLVEVEVLVDLSPSCSDDGEGSLSESVVLPGRMSSAPELSIGVRTPLLSGLRLYTPQRSESDLKTDLFEKTAASMLPISSGSLWL